MGARWIRPNNMLDQLFRIDPMTSQVTAATRVRAEFELNFLVEDNAIWMLQNEELWRWGPSATE